MAKRKGFPLKLQKSNWLYMRQVYLWLQSKDMTTPEMDGIADLFPDPVPSDAALEGKRGYGARDRVVNVHVGFGRELRGYKTVRFRADQIGALRVTLETIAIFAQYGQMNYTLRCRLDEIARIPPMELLADASRG